MENCTSDYTSDSSDGENSNKVIDFAYLLLDIDTVEKNLDEAAEDSKKVEEIENLVLHHNQLSTLPKNLKKFVNVRYLDLSNNGLMVLPDLFKYCRLSALIAKNNNLKNDSLPKTFTSNQYLRELNLSGNLMDHFPEQVLAFQNLKYLYLGGNKIKNISKNIYKLSSLQILSMGGNELIEVPFSLGQLKHLQGLVLCDNKIETLPYNIANLNNLKSLQLHKNKLRTLPPAIVTLKNLIELSLRDNPLVVRFVSNISHNPPSLLELSARAIKLHRIVLEPGDIPSSLMCYLSSAHHCVNPTCKGVYFDNRVEHVKFVDFCGKYRIPLLHYLCSAKCATDNVDEDVRLARPYLLKKVLLG